MAFHTPLYFFQYRSRLIPGIVLPLLIPAFSLNAKSQDEIRLNQLGFYSYGPKVAIAVAPETWYFTIRSPDLTATYYTGELSPLVKWSRSGEMVKCADFSGFVRNGTYVVYITGIGASYPFTIGSDNFSEVARGLVRAFFYQRCSAALPAVNALLWSRGAGHPDNKVIIHPSAQSDPSKEGARKTGETFPSPKGWYDAGDYGKYVVNAGITTYQLLLLYEQFPEFFETFNLNIPESGDTVPDLLDEIKWELDWLLTMQDPADGGVYHKVTAKTFCGDVMPDAVAETRYFIGKGTAATFDFAAVLAMASRIYKNRMPPFAETCLDAAMSAWKWGEAYPDSGFTNPPDVVTGEYGDKGLKDEYAWAGYELFLATGDSAYLATARDLPASYNIPGWQGVGMLGYYSMALVDNDSIARSKILSQADGLVNRTRSNPYRTTINNDFYWGSNGVVANQGMTQLVAFLLTKECAYLEGAIHSIDYLLGRNAVGYSFVTGFGIRSPLHPHHRPSTADRLTAPVPGFLVGGPNGSAGDGCSGPYPPESAKSWLDQSCSYSTNEVAINWNAPAAFLAGGISAVFTSSDRFDLGDLRVKYASDTTLPAETAVTAGSVSTTRTVLTVTGGRPSVVTIAYGTDPSLAAPQRTHVERSDSTAVLLSDLLPGTVYYFRHHSIDDQGNHEVSAVDSFRTDDHVLAVPELSTVDHGSYKTGSDLTVSFRHPTATRARVVYSRGGSATATSVSCSMAGDRFTAVIPADEVTCTGLTYRIFVYDTVENLSTPPAAAAPDSFTLSTDNFCTAGLYTMVSLPGIFRPAPSAVLFNPEFGDTAGWRYFGYSAPDSGYTVFDSLHTGSGGWLFAKSGHSFSHSTGGIPPDTLFPIVLNGGWNCIGSPFPFPVFWANSCLDIDGALVAITDSVAFRFVHRQIFRYEDTIINGRNSGSYRSNRRLDSHVFNDSMTLDPWKSYWVYSAGDSTTLLIDPQPEIRMRKLIKARQYSVRSWYCAVTASCGSSTGEPSVFGRTEQALDGFDLCDSPKPPEVAGRPRSAFLHHEWNTPATAFAADIAGIDAGSGRRWELTIAGEPARPVTLTWKFSGIPEMPVYLVDPATGQTVIMGSAGSYTAPPAAAAADRKLVFVESATAPATETLPARWSFTRCTGTALRFSCTVPAETAAAPRPVSITVFDLYGRTIRVLYRDMRYPGTYTVEWDGRGNNGTAAANGVYLVRFSSGSYSANLACHLTR